MMTHRVLRAMGPVAVLLVMVGGMPAPAGAQQVSMESLMATADSGLASARAGVATAGLKLALEEKEREEQAAARESVTSAPAPTPTPGQPPAPASAPAPAPAPTPAAEEATAAVEEDSAAGAPFEPSLESLEVDDSAAAASSDRLNTLLPAPVLAQAIAAAETVTTDPAEPRIPMKAVAPTPAAAGVPLAEVVGATLENGLAGAASMTADWTTLFRGLVDRHPGVMPALLLLMTAAGATALAVGAGIRPGRRRRAAGGPDGDPSAPPSPRQLRMRPDQRVPRDVAAVLASLEGRRGASPLYGRDPRDSAADRRTG